MVQIYIIVDQKKYFENQISIMKTNRELDGNNARITKFTVSIQTEKDSYRKNIIERKIKITKLEVLIFVRERKLTIYTTKIYI